MNGSYTGDGGKSFSRYEREMYPDEVAEMESDCEEQEGDDHDEE